MSEMEKLETAVSKLPELSPILPRKLKYTGKKVKGQHMEISAVTCPDCTTEWCDFSGASCEPDVGETRVAWRNGDEWVLTEEGFMGFEEDIQAFLEGETLDAYEGD
jgi:hypothetical protein